MAVTAAEPTSAPAGERIIDLDVTRAIALIGVCVMNYHGYLLLRGAHPGSGLWTRVFDPVTGPLTSRFAAVFVTVAGMGVSLMTRRSTAGDDHAAISRDRRTLVRRGVLLFSFGFFLDWIWPGTILFFYGAYFLVGALVFTLPSRWIVAVGTSAALGAGGIQWWVVDRTTGGHATNWLTSGDAEAHHSPRDLVLDTFVRGTHPLLPWLLFFCLGIVLGRRLPFDGRFRRRLAAAGGGCAVVGYVLHGVLSWHPTLRSTGPFDHGLLYALTTIGVTLVAVSLVGWLAERTSRTAITQALAITGRTTLTLYVLHVLVFDLLVDRLNWVRPGGLATPLCFAVAFWLIAILFANGWNRWHRQGPLEWMYRAFS